MIHEQTKRHIQRLDDGALIEYVTLGERLCDPEAIAFARDQLDLRNLAPEQIAGCMPAILKNVAQFDATASIDLVRLQNNAILCQRCGYEVPTRYFAYDQNIGAVHIRFHRQYRGFFCKRCSIRLFLKSSGITLILGWWGMISFFVSIAYLLRNLAAGLHTLFMPGAPHLARRPELNPHIAEKIAPLLTAITDELTSGNNINDIARALAPRAGITPGQMYCFVRQIVDVDNENEKQPRWNHGFPVEFG